jgi:hypothetical protein
MAGCLEAAQNGVTQVFGVDSFGSGDASITVQVNRWECAFLTRFPKCSWLKLS